MQDVIIPREELRQMLLPVREANLPVPRLHFVLMDRGKYDMAGLEVRVDVCYYLLIFPVIKWDIRNLNKGEGDIGLEPGWTATVLGITTIRGGKADVPESYLEPPFRDGVHAKYDSRTFGGFFGIPTYVSRGAKYRLIPTEEK